MTRFLRQTTAITAMLALGAPQAGLAQVSISAEDVAAHRAAMAAEQPQLAAKLAEELAAGLAPDGLTCAAPTQGQPCPDGTPMVTPGGLAVWLAEDGNILLASPADQDLARALVQDPAPVVPEAATDDTAATAGDAPADDAVADTADTTATDATATGDATDSGAAEAEQAAPPARKPLDATAPAAKPDAGPATDEASDAGDAGDAEASPDTAPLQDDEPDTSATATESESPVTAADADSGPSEDDLAASLAAAEAETGAENATTADDTVADDTADAISNEAADEAATAGDAVAQAGQTEAAGDTATDDVADADAAGDAATGDNTASDTATDADTPDADIDELARSLAAAGVEPAQDDTAPEARIESPDAAATRAAEADAPEAAALAIEDLDAVDADLETLTVTEETARSSAEDFATSMAEAARAALGADADTDTGTDAAQSAAATSATAADSDDTDRDIARALLAGLAGYAVGQMLPDHQGQVALNSGDRVVITHQDGSQEVLKDDSVLMFQPGTQVQTQTFDDGSSRVVVNRDDGSRVITIRDGDLRVLRRTLVRADGTVVKLIDDTAEVAPVVVSDLPPAARPQPPASLDDEAALRRALAIEADTSRRFTLGQIRAIAGVRALVAPINIDAITFDTGSAAIRPDQARQLAALGRVIADQTRADPGELFLIEGYTDTVGAEAMNLALSDRRAESLALALTEYFDVPPENLVVQGYGERFLKVPVEGDVRENRRVAVRRITDLLARD